MKAIISSLRAGLAVAVLCLASSGQSKIQPPGRHNAVLKADTVPDGPVPGLLPGSLVGIQLEPAPTNTPHGHGLGQSDSSAPDRELLPTPSAVPPNEAEVPSPVNQASHLLGMTVKNPQNQTLGRIRDVVFDIKDGHVAYVVMAKSGRAHGTGADLAVPLTSFTPSADRKSLILDTDKRSVQNSPGFSGNNMPPINDPVFGASNEGSGHHDIIIVPVPAPSQDSNENPQDKNQHEELSPQTDQGPKIENP